MFRLIFFLSFLSLSMTSCKWEKLYRSSEEKKSIIQQQNDSLLALNSKTVADNRRFAIENDSLWKAVQILNKKNNQLEFINSVLK